MFHSQYLKIIEYSGDVNAYFIHKRFVLPAKGAWIENNTKGLLWLHLFLETSLQRGFPARLVGFRRKWKDVTWVRVKDLGPRTVLRRGVPLGVCSEVSIADMRGAAAEKIGAVPQT